MPYDNSLDKQLFENSWEKDNVKIAVSVHSYNEGPKKLQIVREVKNRDGNFIFARLGRLSREELEGILPLIEEAKNKM